MSSHTQAMEISTKVCNPIPSTSDYACQFICVIFDHLHIKSLTSCISFLSGSLHLRIRTHVCGPCANHWGLYHPQRYFGFCYGYSRDQSVPTFNPIREFSFSFSWARANRGALLTIYFYFYFYFECSCWWLEECFSCRPPMRSLEQWWAFRWITSRTFW